MKESDTIFLNASGEKSHPTQKWTPKWTPEKVIQSIRARLRQKHSLGSVVMYQEDLALYAAGRRIFGAWANALRAAGLNLSKHLGRRKWTTQEVVAEAVKWIKRHPKKPRSGSRLLNRWIYIHHLVHKHSPEAKIRLAELGIRWPPYPRSGPKWTREAIIKEIQNRVKRGQKINVSSVNGGSLPRVAAYRFGSYRQAVEAAGFDYAKIRLKSGRPRINTNLPSAGRIYPR